jgi:hypothetical protein
MSKPHQARTMIRVSFQSTVRKTLRAACNVQHESILLGRRPRPIVVEAMQLPKRAPRLRLVPFLACHHGTRTASICPPPTSNQLELKLSRDVTSCNPFSSHLHSNPLVTMLLTDVIGWRKLHFLDRRSILGMDVS